MRRAITLLAVVPWAWCVLVAVLDRRHRLSLDDVEPLADGPLVSVIVPARDEERGVQAAIASLAAQEYGALEVIVVDDDSPDETWRIAAEMNNPNVKVIRRVSTRGLASAFNRGILESRGQVVCWMDADMCMPPALLPAMIDKLKEVDIVIGSRYVEGALDDRDPLRVTASRLINGLASLVLGYGIRDYDSGFVVLRRSVFDKVSIIPTGYGAYFMEFIYTCRSKGLTVYELPYVFRDRTKGVSKSAPSLIKFLSTGSQYVLRIFVARLRRSD